MKVFLGVPVTGDARTAVAALATRLRQRASELAPRARLSWVPEHRFHLTVLYIGHVTPPEVEAMTLALGPSFREPPFPLGLTGVGVFPPSGRPRVVWAGCGEGVEPFRRLHREACKRVSAVRPIEPEHDPRPHLTLARVKDAAGLRSAPLLSGVADVALGAIDVSAVTLFDSRPASDGVVYVPLADIPLAPPDRAPHADAGAVRSG